MNAEINKKIQQLKRDRLHGAGWLSRYAIDTMILSIRKSSVTDKIGLLAELDSLSKQLIAARKNMVSISNYISLFLKQISINERKYHDLTLFKKAIISNGTNLISKMDENIAQAAMNAAKLIESGDTIITCSYSSSFCRTMEIASKKTDYKIIACVSATGNTSYGILTEKSLARSHIKVTIIRDTEIDKYVAKSSKVITGVDTILLSGDIINGFPSFRLVQAASEYDIPYHAICENAKFDINGLLNINTELEKGFDRIPYKWLNSVFTESGQIVHDDIPDHINYLNKVLI